jgi:hypothetical protein
MSKKLDVLKQHCKNIEASNSFEQFKKAQLAYIKVLICDLESREKAEEAMDEVFSLTWEEVSTHD